jgi:hypothetical protein
VQVLPELAKEAAAVTVFQRTAQYVTPAQAGPLHPQLVALWKANYREIRRRTKLTAGGIPIPSPYQSALELSPQDRAAICEEAWRRGNQPNVTLVDLRADPIELITPDGIKTTSAQHRLDVIVYATGFDALTGSLLALNITGRDAVSLADAWSGGPQTYLGLMVPQFPNLFTITGPGSPGVVTNVPVAIEQHVEWIADTLSHLRGSGTRVIEATDDAAAEWTAHVQAVASETLYPVADSWYLGANIPGKPRVFLPYLGGLGVYRKKCDAVAAAGYLGFALDGVGQPAAAPASHKTERVPPALPVAQARRGYRAQASRPLPEVGTVTDRTIAVAGGSIPVRVIAPAE